MQGSVCVYDVAIDILADGAVDREFLIMLNIFWQLGLRDPSNPRHAVISCHTVQSLPQMHGCVSENIPVSWFSHGHAMPLHTMAYHGHVMAMARLCTGEPSRDICPGKEVTCAILDRGSSKQAGMLGRQTCQAAWQTDLPSPLATVPSATWVIWITSLELRKRK